MELNSGREILAEMTERRKTRKVKVGGVAIGGGAPIVMQSMVKVETADTRRIIAQIGRLEKAGCEIVRVAVKSPEDADSVKTIRKRIRIPLVCDIHFNYKLALKAIENGADKIRLNPGNIRKPGEIAEVVKAAKHAGIPIRIGVNSGSIAGDYALGIQDPKKGAAPQQLVGAALRYVKLFEDLGFHDIIISIKSSDVISTVESYRRMADACDYPLHLGVTAAGTYDTGIIKSSIGIGALLLDGIGDTIRVSLTADPIDEVIAAKRILSSLGLRKFGPSIISCPTCGRCQVDLKRIVKELEHKLTIHDSRSMNHKPRTTTKRPLTIAIMGCEVNGPGEAAAADIGIAAGKGTGALFVNGKILRRVKEKDFAKELLKEIGRI
jgi:(E)-4-hydroxy-3-methylbut-2-enyl-diphosphate synthase